MLRYAAAVLALFLAAPASIAAEVPQPLPQTISFPLATGGANSCQVHSSKRQLFSVITEGAPLVIFTLSVKGLGQGEKWFLRCGGGESVAFDTAYEAKIVRAEPLESLANPLLVAEADATESWGAVPCGGNVGLRWTGALHSPLLLFGQIAMESSWDDFLAFPGRDARNKEGWSYPAADFTNCLVAISYPTFSSRDGPLGDWAEFCTDMTHEWEHLLDYWAIETSIDNGTAPLPPLTSIAYPSYTGQNEPSSCKTLMPYGAL